MLKNFLYGVCGFHGNYTLVDREHQAVEYIRYSFPLFTFLRLYRNRVGDKKVLVLVSGGVDSTVCAALLTKAIGTDKVKALHIDNG